ncbi:transposon ty3-G gag-pol polyprotein [Tanacetum coccineum]
MKPAGLLQTLPISEQVWEDVSMDFVEGLPNSNGFTAVMVVVDRISKYAHFVPLRHPFTATTITQEFVSNIVRLHGIPSTVVVYGRPPPKFLPYVPGTTNIQVVDEYLCDRDELLRQLRANLLAAQHRMKIQADHHRRELEFEKGDLVFVKLQPYRQTSVATRVSNKLSPRFFRSYRLLDKVGEVAYQVELPSGSLKHNVFDVSLLRRCVGSAIDLSPTTIDASVLPSVKWLGRPREDATWETKWRFIRSYPNFRLEDKSSAEFSKALLGRFGPTDYEDPAEALSRLQQTTTVASYQEAFEKNSHQVDGLPEILLVGCFIGGLKEEIRLEVKLKTPKNLTEAIDMALLVEEKLNLQRRGYTSQRFLALPAPSESTTTQGILGPSPNQRINLLAPNPIQRLSQTKARKRRVKGLCYYCDDRYTPGHKCSKPQLFMISDVFEVEDEENIGDTQEHNPDDSLAEISFHAISGSINPQTLRLPGKIKNKEVVVLIDGGRTYNFIDQALADRFGLVVETDTPFQVVGGNREHVTCTGRMHNLTIVIQGYVVSTDFFVLLVAACPIVLGVQWLKTLGLVEMDYEQITIGFRLAGSSHKLRGLKGFELAALKAHELMGIQGAALLLQITLVPTKILPKRSPCPVIQQVLTQFSTVFQNPTTLPPKRFQDHGIPLLLGSRPVSTHPYRQPYL